MTTPAPSLLESWLKTRWEDATPAEWAGRRRMAEVRRAVGLPLDVIDREAVARNEPDPVSPSRGSW
jgi:hypothetical protein